MNRSTLQLHVELLETRTTPSVSHFTPPHGANPANAYVVSGVRTPGPAQTGYDFVLTQQGSTVVAVPAAESGKVVLTRVFPGAGKTVVVEYNDGTAQLFAHLQMFAVVKGQNIIQGQAVGIQGHTGPQRSNNLFTEVGHWNDRAQQFLPDRNSRQTDAFIREYLAVLQKGGYNPFATLPRGGAAEADGNSGQDSQPNLLFNTNPALTTTVPTPSPTTPICDDNTTSSCVDTSSSNDCVDSTPVDCVTDDTSYSDCSTDDSSSADTGSDF